MYKIALAAAMSLMATIASAEMIKVASPHSVEETINRLTAAVEGAGATVIARVEHAKAAKSAGLDLAPSTLLIFGNPKVGTLAIQQNPLAGVVLPARILAYQDADGAVWLAYENPADMLAKFDIPADAPIVRRLTMGFGMVTGKAVAK